MKYTTEVIIEKPVQEVAGLYQNPENIKKWQPGLIDYNHLSGEPGREGCISVLHYKIGKRKIEMKETIARTDPPNEFDAVYEAKGVYNLMQNRFEKVGMDSTRWIAISEFKFKGFMKLMAPLMKTAFKKQTLKSLNQFKAFAENN